MIIPFRFMLRNPYRFAKLEIRRLMFFLGLAVSNVTLLLVDFSFCGERSRSFSISAAEMFSLPICGILHGFVGSIFGIQQDSVSLFVGLADDAVTWSSNFFWRDCGHRSSGVPAPFVRCISSFSFSINRRLASKSVKTSSKDSASLEQCAWHLR